MYFTLIMTWLSCIQAEVILFLFVPDDGRRPKHVVQDKTNKLIKAYLIDLWIESCVDGSILEKVIRHNKMQTSTMYNKSS
jgi:hypothetical protein